MKSSPAPLPAWAIPLAIAAMTLIWGSSWPVVRVGLDSFPPFTFAAIRAGLAALLLVGLLAIRRIPLPPRKLLIAIFVIGVVAHGGNFATSYWGQTRVDAGVSAVLFSTLPLFVVVLAHFWLKEERLTGGTVLGLLLGLAGTIILYWDQAGRGESSLVGALAILASAGLAGLGTVGTKKIGGSIHPIVVTTLQLAGGALTLSLLALIGEANTPIRWNGSGIMALIYLTLFASCLAFLLFYWALQRIPATHLSLVSYLTPPVAVIIGVVALNEQFSLNILAGMATIAAGVWLAERGSGE